MALNPVAYWKEATYYQVADYMKKNAVPMTAEGVANAQMFVTNVRLKVSEITNARMTKIRAILAEMDAAVSPTTGPAPAKPVKDAVKKAKTKLVLEKGALVSDFPTGPMTVIRHAEVAAPPPKEEALSFMSLLERSIDSRVEVTEGRIISAMSEMLEFQSKQHRLQMESLAANHERQIQELEARLWKGWGIDAPAAAPAEQTLPPEAPAPKLDEILTSVETKVPVKAKLPKVLVYGPSAKQHGLIRTALQEEGLDKVFDPVMFSTTEDVKTIHRGFDHAFALVNFTDQASRKGFKTRVNDPDNCHFVTGSTSSMVLALKELGTRLKKLAETSK